jgi:hypothetical protein
LVRYETGDLGHLPEDDEQKVASGKFRSAAVGACQSAGSGDFARYRITILLF